MIELYQEISKSERLRELTEKIALHQRTFDMLRKEIQKQIIGQNELITNLFIAILSDGHVLLEGVPGLAKTKAIKSLSACLDVSFSRIQFTPDLLPADIIGTQIYHQKSESFQAKKGPIFASFILADEINRAPAKVQSALLEAMQERQITIGDESFKLPEPFLVMATQNPIEQEGTYTLPEAQIDRFMLKVRITYPSQEEELNILRQQINEELLAPLTAVVTYKELLHIKSLINEVYMDEKIERYILSIIAATRNPLEYGLDDKQRYIVSGASPRGTIYLAKAAKANALLNGRAFVIPEDVQDVAVNVIAHRLILSYEADIEKVTAEAIIQHIIATLEVP
jgi:MoxR-like ATPase